jgi:SAM-dependent methyltransferase
MDDKTIRAETRDYFQRVMDDWQEEMQSSDGHPYAHNASWQAHYAMLQRWVATTGLRDGLVLEVGCGTGLLQHVVPNYIGVDIATSSAQFMSRPFLVASADKLPFADDTFDGLWSFWVLEHLSAPEEMLAEIRRVVKPGGTLFLVAAYSVGSWVSRGIHMRSYRDLSPKERLVKLTLPFRASRVGRLLSALPTRLASLITFMMRPEPSRLRYRRLEPNYEVYWDYDADACVSLDSYNIALYFLSRGDAPVFHGGVFRSLLQRSQAQMYVIGS